MMQTFRLSDVLRCILLNAPRGPNLACPRDDLFQARSPRYSLLWQEAVAQDPDRVTLVRWSGLKLAGLASARTRNGARVWEIDHLYLPTVESRKANGQGPYATGDAVSLEIVESLVQKAGCRSAERIFLRLPADSPAIPLARRVGFFPFTSETLMVGSDVAAPNGTGDGVYLSAHPLEPPNYHGLFKLFSAATPHPIRIALGLTYDQWQEAQEPQSGKGTQWIVEDKGRTTAWLSLSRCRGVIQGQVLVHPDYPRLLPGLLAMALAYGGTQHWLVPDYQESVRDSLRLQGFQDVARYTMLVKTVAVPVVTRGMAPVEA